LVERLLKERGIELHTKAPEPLVTAASPALDSASGTPRPQAPAPSTETLRTTPLSREEAIAMLTSIAQYFKQNEPQSPVPYLLERAVKWGNMPLEAWLSDVIKDSNVVNSVKDMLGPERVEIPGLMGQARLPL
jgi:type VI secretion system protein ImpA